MIVGSPQRVAYDGDVHYTVSTHRFHLGSGDRLPMKMDQMLRRRQLAPAVCMLAVLIVAVPAAGQNDAEQPRELEDWERAELQELVQVVVAARRGELTPAADPFELTPSYLKGADGNTYVPFTLTIDPAKLSESNVAVYVHVIEHQAAPATAATAETDDSDESETPEAVLDQWLVDLPDAIFEDAYFVQVEEGDDGAAHLSRAFSVPSGDYDVYVALRDSKGADADDDARAAATTVMMLKEELSVPNLWTTDLQTSSVLIAEVVEPLSAPLSPQEQIQQPYTLGTTRIVPKYDRSFGKRDELSLIMLVYNPTLAANQMPDVTVEYNFHSKTDSGEEFFNKTTPQQFNAQSLPSGFSVELGHQIVAGQSVPLSLFPEGAYRLEIKVTDNTAGVSVIQEVMFTVGGL